MSLTAVRESVPLERGGALPAVRVAYNATQFLKKLAGTGV